MPPAQTDTSVRDMTQRLLEQFRGDIRARAQRPPPEQKRKELQPAQPKPPPRPLRRHPGAAAGLLRRAAVHRAARHAARRHAARAGGLPGGLLGDGDALPFRADRSALLGGAARQLAHRLHADGRPGAGAAAPRDPRRGLRGGVFPRSRSPPTLPSIGEELSLERGGKATVLAQEQGPGAATFRVKTVERELLLRWRSDPSPAARETLQRAAQNSMPHGALLWPVDLATSAKASGFGCLTPLPRPQFSPFSALLDGAPTPLRPRVTAALHLAEVALALHGAGWSLHGLSLGDVFLDPTEGEPRLAGWDRILGIVEGSAGSEMLAPEARGGQKIEGSYPDLHTLAILQFCLIYQHFPFAGRQALGLPARDPATLEKLAAAPVFLFDAGRRENEAVPLAQDPSGRAGGRAIALWNSTLADTRALFQQAFVDGLKNPGMRPGASSWRLALGKLRDALFPCAHCGTDNVYDLAALQAPGAAPRGAASSAAAS
jgi:hypothetical protein